MNAAAATDILQLVTLGGKECLFFPSAPVHVSLIRASAADDAGNLFMDREPASLTAFVQAAAARSSGGKVIAQVQRIVPRGSVPATQCEGSWNARGSHSDRFRTPAGGRHPIRPIIVRPVEGDAGCGDSRAYRAVDRAARHR